MKSQPQPTFTENELRLIHAVLYAGAIRSIDIEDLSYRQLADDLLKVAGPTLVTSKIQKEFSVCGLDLALPGFTPQGERV